jgi:pilus assembly protein Flp/PilA
MTKRNRAMKKILFLFIADKSGATAIEYGLIAALISVACITALSTFGGNLNNKFSSISNDLN